MTTINLFMISKNTNSPILQFTNLKYCKMSFKTFKMKWHVFKVINKKHYTVNKGFLKALLPLCSILNSWIGEMENSCFRFLMSRTVIFRVLLANSYYLTWPQHLISQFGYDTIWMLSIDFLAIAKTNSSWPWRNFFVISQLLYLIFTKT